MKLKIVTKEDLKDWTKELFEEKSYNMIDVSDKKVTLRRALACGSIIVGSKVFDLIEKQNMPKGDPISLAEVAGLLGVKKTSDLIPLCHPLSIIWARLFFNPYDFFSTLAVAPTFFSPLRLFFRPCDFFSALVVFFSTLVDFF